MSAPKAYSYIRFSRPEQMRGDSLRRQIAGAQEWAKARGVVIDETLKDLGVSGFRGKNRTEGALSKFLALVEEGRIARGSYLILESLDRMSREAVIDILPRFLDVINAGVTIVTLFDRQEYSRERLRNDWTPLVMSLAIMARSHEESKTKFDRLMTIWSEKRKSNEVMTAIIPGWLEITRGADGKRRIVENPERAAIVRRIFAETLAGYGRRTICTRLNKEGVKPFGRSRGWQPSYIKKVLSSRTVLGELQTWTRGEDGVRRPACEPHANYYPAIIDEATFARAQMALAGRAKAAGKRGPKAANLLVGLLRCSCGARMQRLNKGAPPKGGSYFVCSDAARGLACGHDRKWRTDRIEEKVIGMLRSEDLERALTPPKTPEVRVAEGLRARIAMAETERRRWADAFGAGDDFAADEIKALSARIAALKGDLREAEREEAETASAEPPSVVIGRAREIAARLADATDEDAADLRRRLAQSIRELISEITFWPERVTVTGKRRIPRYVPGRPRVLPRFVDGKPVTEWEATWTLLEDHYVPPGAFDDTDLDVWDYDEDGERVPRRFAPFSRRA